MDREEQKSEVTGSNPNMSGERATNTQVSRKQAARSRSFRKLSIPYPARRLDTTSPGPRNTERAPRKTSHHSFTWDVRITRLPLTGRSRVETTSETVEADRDCPRQQCGTKSTHCADNAEGHGRINSNRSTQAEAGSDTTTASFLSERVVQEVALDLTGGAAGGVGRKCLRGALQPKCRGAAGCGARAAGLRTMMSCRLRPWISHKTQPR